MERIPRISARVELVAWAAMLLIGLALAWSQIELFTHPDFGAGSWIEPGFAAIRVPAAIAMWALALRLTQSRAGRMVARVEPYVFIAFCSHMIVGTVIWALWSFELGGYYAQAYPVFFFLMPMAVMVSAVVLVEAGRRFCPQPLSWLNGTRFEAPSARKVAVAALRRRVSPGFQEALRHTRPQ